MTIFRKFFLSLFLVSIFLSLFITSSAVAANYQLDTFAKKAGYSTTGAGASLESSIQSVINTILSLTGILFLILTVYAGVRWMTARGNEELVTTARNTLEAAITGLVIVSVSYAVTSLVFKSLPSGIPNVPNAPVVTKCTIDADCKSGEKCDSTAGTCSAVASKCIADTDCKSTETCDPNGTCILKPIPCDINTICPIAGELCNLQTGTCQKSEAPVGTSCGLAGLDGTCQNDSYGLLNKTSNIITDINSACLKLLTCYSGPGKCEKDLSCTATNENNYCNQTTHTCATKNPEQICKDFNNSDPNNYWLYAFTKCVSKSEYDACANTKTNCNQNCQKPQNTCLSDCNGFDKLLTDCSIASDKTSCLMANASVSAKKLLCINKCGSLNDKTANCIMIDCQNAYTQCIKNIGSLY